MNIRNIKRISILLILGLLIMNLPFFTGMIYAQEDQKQISITVNGLDVSFDSPPIIEEGRTLVPLRAIFESLDADVVWDAIERKVTSTKGETTIVLYIGNNVAMVNGESITLDVPPRIVNGRTLVPVRFISESFGADVKWDGINKIVAIATDKPYTGIEIPGFTLPDNELATLPNWVKEGLNLSIIDKGYDSAKIYMDSLSVQEGVNISDIKLDNEYDTLAFIPDQTIMWSTGCDFSPYVTFQGNQSNTGGCIGRSLVHIMNIIKEREHKYTPDVSFWYLHSRQVQLADGGPIDTQFVLQSNGISPEAYAHTDYDGAVKKTNPDGSMYYDYSGMPQPNGWTNALAKYYRMMESEKFEPTSQNIRFALREYGPLLAGGDMPLILGNDPVEGHAVTIVGYNDLTRTVKCLNSYSDLWGPTENGYLTISYDDLAENFEYVRFYVSVPVERAGTDQAYSARIHIETGGYSRIKLKVTIGIDDKSPLTVWDTPNEEVFIDYSKTLKLDVPLPTYASSNWPPERGTHWYVEVVNTSTWDTAELKEITLAKLLKDSSGNYDMETFKSKDAGTILQPGETRKFFIPNIEKIDVMPIEPIFDPITVPIEPITQPIINPL
ncbi:stalk domain-containing protein [Gudongella sp. DL1XJH-153]|uniref:stalk domain-containing protein n=1 Tax=Gudongella sp. DL1XJH-153 TaxID=3409804 RepID=UPI003BB6F2BC